MKKGKDNSKTIKIIIFSIIAIVVILLFVLIYNNLFSGSGSNRLEGISSHIITKDEMESVKGKLNELENIDSVDVNTNPKTKIVKIFVRLKDDIEFDKVKTISNEVLTDFSEDNLKFYDIEIFVESLNSESTVYPQIGYKHKTSSEFAW